MSEAEAPPPAQDQLMEEAAAWFARMRGPEAEASREAFEAWLARGALHRRAYNRAAEIFAMGKMLAEEGPAKEKGRQDALRLVLPVLAVLLALAATGWLALGILSPGDAPDTNMADAGTGRGQLLATAAGETRLVRLADGSRVALGRNTAIEVRLGPSERRLELVRGRARFDVFRNPRPFVVHAGGGRVTARGTLFDVALSPDRRVTVHLIAGIVDVTLPAAAVPEAPGPITRRLRAGETLSFASRSGTAAGATGQGDAAGAPPPPAIPAAARDYEAVTLAELIAAANSTSPRPIRLADPAIGERRVSGRFRIHDTGLLAERLAILFGLAVDRTNPGEIVLRNR